MNKRFYQGLTVVGSLAALTALPVIRLPAAPAPAAARAGRVVIPAVTPAAQRVRAPVPAGGRSLFSAARAAAPARRRVLPKVEQLFRLGFAPTLPGALVLGSLRTTRDPALATYYLRASRTSHPELQLTGLLDASYVSGNPHLIHVRQLLAIAAPKLLTPSLALLIEYGHLTNLQLVQIARLAPEPAQRLMAAAELVNRDSASSRQTRLAAGIIRDLLASASHSVRGYAALSALQLHDAKLQPSALAVLNRLAASRSPRLQHLRRALLARVAAQKITVALPWVRRIAANVHASSGTRRQAVRTLLRLHDQSAPVLLARMIADTHGEVPRIELGFLAIQFGRQLTVDAVAPLARTHSPLLSGVAAAAQAVAQRHDALQPMMKLIQQGQPIFLNWLLLYCRHAKVPHRRRLLMQLVEYSTIVDGHRGMDYLRAVAAATLLANGDSPADRAGLAKGLRSANPGVVEAALAGMLRSYKNNFAPLVTPHWTQLQANPDQRIGQFAALILASEGVPAARPVLRRMVLQGYGRGPGIRAVAGWYYAKLTGQQKTLLAAVVGPATTATSPAASRP